MLGGDDSLSKAICDAFVLPKGAGRTSPAFEEEITRVLSLASQAWSGVYVEPAAFLRFLAKRLQNAQRLDDALGRLHTDDLYLALACIEGSSAAIVHFDEKLQTVVRHLDRRLAQDKDVKDDFLQRVRERLLIGPERGHPYLEKYGGRSSLQSWLRTVVVRQWITLQHRERGNTNTSLESVALANLKDAACDPEMAYLKSHYLEQFRHAFRQAILDLSVRNRLVMRYHLMDRLSIDDIGKVFGVHRATVARWLGSIREALLTGTQSRLRETLNVRQEELDSIMRLLGSSLDVSFDGILNVETHPSGTADGRGAGFRGPALC
jgi:RNA polymerase sigma-70 factor (ECF subfamily)